MGELVKYARDKAAPSRGGPKLSRAKGHMPQLDGLRGLAVTAVIFHHAIGESWQRLNLGFFGVELFFVMSGFLIGGILRRARKAAEEEGLGLGGVWQAFYARRMLRIFPLYYGVLLGAAWINMPEVRENLPFTLTYMSNMKQILTFDRMPAPMVHLWSLASEEQFYLIAPAILLFSRWRSLAKIAVAMIIIAPLSRILIGMMWVGETCGSGWGSCRGAWIPWAKAYCWRCFGKRGRIGAARIQRPSWWWRWSCWASR